MPILVRRVVRKPRALLLAALCSGVLAACGQPSTDMMASAKDYLSKNDLNAASIQLKNALQEDANLAEARFLLGTVHLRQRNVPGALKELQRAQELGYSEVELAPHLARAWVLGGTPERAIEKFAAVTVDNAEQRAMLKAALGDAYAAREDVDTARKEYQAALSVVPTHLDARMGLARLAWLKESADAALLEADRAVADHPEAAEAHALRGDILSALNRPKEAIQEFEKAVQLLPRAVGYHYALISQLLREGEMEVAEVRLEQLQAIAPKEAATQYLRAFVEFQRNQLEPARTAIEQVLRQTPDNLAGQLLAGGIYLKMEDHVQAQRQLEAVLARVPGQPLARRYLAASLLATGEAVRARELLEPIISTQADGETLTLAGQAFLAAGDFDQAAEYFAQAVQERPEDVQARTRLAVASLSRGDEARAVAELEEAVRLDTTSGQPDLALVMTLLRAGEFDKALVAHQALESKQPNNPQTYNLKGGIYLAQSKPGAARGAFEKALELKADFLPAAVNLARLDIADGRSAEAEQRFAKVIAANPGQADAYLMLADLKVRGGSAPADVRAVLQRAAAAQPNGVAPKLALVRFHLSQREASQALSMAHEVAASHPNDPAVLRVLAQAQMVGGEQEQALNTLQRMARLMPDSPQPLVEMADAQRAMGDVHGAEQSLRRALTIQAATLEAQQRLVSILVGQKKYADALRVANTIQKQRPQQSIGLVYEADIHAAAQDWPPAIKALRAALALKPETALAVKLHAALMKAGQTAEAAEWEKQWLIDHPQDLALPSYLAERALNEQRFEDAEQIYRELLKKSADNPLLLNNLAWVAGQLKRDDALALGRRAHELAPNNAAVLDTLGMLLVDRGQAQEGLGLLQQAVEVAPQETGLRVNLARAHQALGQTDQARQVLSKALENAPEGSPMRAEIMKLQAAL